MTQLFKLSDLFRDSAYKLTQFKVSQIQSLESSITVKESGKISTPYAHLIETLGLPDKIFNEFMEYGVTLAR